MRYVFLPWLMVHRLTLLILLTTLPNLISYYIFLPNCNIKGEFIMVVVYYFPHSCMFVFCVCLKNIFLSQNICSRFSSSSSPVFLAVFWCVILFWNWNHFSCQAFVPCVCPMDLRPSQSPVMRYVPTVTFVPLWPGCHIDFAVYFASFMSISALKWSFRDGTFEF